MSSRIRTFPIVGLHGAPVLAPPGSTVASFQKAVDCGASMLALTVRSTSDSVLVVDHEAMRHFNGTDAPLREHPWRVWQPYYADTSTPLALLADVLDMAKTGGLGVLLDVREPGTEGGVARALRQSGLPMSDILVSAPTGDSRRTLRGLDPRLPHTLTLESDSRLFVDAKLLASLDTDAVTWAAKLLTPAVVTVLRLREIASYAWDVDGTDEMRRLRDVCGVDGIVTRRPELLHSLPPS